MTFSVTFFEILIHGALVWTALAAAGLTAMLVRDLIKGESW